MEAAVASGASSPKPALGTGKSRRRVRQSMIHAGYQFFKRKPTVNRKSSLLVMTASEMGITFYGRLASQLYDQKEEHVPFEFYLLNLVVKATVSF